MDITNKITGLHRLLLPLLFSAMLLLLLPACVEEQTPHNNDNETTITFSVNTPKDFSPTSYALSEEDEEAISTVDVLLFDKDGEQNFLSGPHYGILNGSEVTIRIPSAAENYNMAVFANCRAELNQAFSTSLTKDDVLESLTRTVIAGNADDGLVGGASAGWLTTDGNKTIPMYGEYATDQTVNLVRMLARINVIIGAEGQPAVPFTLSEVYLCNYNNKGQIAPASGWSITNPSVASSAQTGFDKSIKYIATDNDKLEREIYTFEANAGILDNANNPCIIIGGEYNSSGITTYYRIDFVDGDGDYLHLLRNHSYNVSITKISDMGHSRPEYAFDSRPVNVEYIITAWDDSQVGGVVTDGQYMLSVSAPTLNFDATARTISSTDNILTITCNYSTSVKIDNVSVGDGGWLQVVNEDGSAISGNTITLDGNNHAKIRLVFGNNISAGSAARTGSFVLTAGNMSYTVNVEQSNQLLIGPDIANALSQPESNCYIVPPRKGILIPVSRANYPDPVNTDATVTQLGSSDAFTAGLVWMSNADNTTVGGLGSGSTTSCLKTISPVGSGSSGYVLVETGSKEGNAVVAIKNTANPSQILWSWHIWVTSDTPQAKEGSAADNDASRAFMDRNLGAFNDGNPTTDTPWSNINAQTFGLLYQWGRKDPFPGSYGVHPDNTNGIEPTIYYGPFSVTGKDVGNQQYSIVTESGKQTISYSVQNPDKYFSTSDWTDEMSGNNSERWGTTGSGGTDYSSNKSVYDPCPPGWRVPRHGSWSTTKGANADGTDGWLASVAGYAQRNDKFGGVYPAAGGRNSSGTFNNVGTVGDYWSGSPNSDNSTNARRLSFNGSSVNTTGSISRASGVSIRCVKDL